MLSAKWQRLAASFASIRPSDAFIRHTSLSAKHKKKKKKDGIIAKGRGGVSKKDAMKME